MAESDALAEFRRTLRGWLAGNVPPPPPFKLPQTFLEVETEAQFRWLQAWQQRLYDAGYVGFDVPEEYGGRGIDPARQAIVAEELIEARAPFLVNFIALHWAGPTILLFGTEAQKRRLLRPLLRADEIWCQGFSEPGAGSDLASLQARAVQQADGSWRVTGHKVWTTVAHFARWMILLARTEEGVNKYASLSYFLCPMEAPGVSVQPLVKLNGEGGFNQVLFDDAPMPADALLGERGQGWNIAMATLMFERGAAERGGKERAAAFFAQLGALVAVAERTPLGAGTVAEDPVFRQRVAALWVEGQAIALSAMRASATALNAERPLALPLMSKLVASEWAQRLAELACEMLGPEAALSLEDPAAPFGGEWPRAFMNSFGMTIGGGTSQILRNILGERVLGLPKSK